MRIFWLETKKILKAPTIIVFLLICVTFNLFNFFAYGLDPLETAEPTNIFEGYKTAHIAEAYISGLGIGGSPAEAMREKYAAMQLVVEQKAQDGDAFGQYASWHHSEIFGDLGTMLMFESIILASLIMLLILGHENINRTELTVYSSKTGRRIMRYKMAAALTVTLGVFAVLTAVTYVPLFITHPEVWEQNISSAFNLYLTDYFVGNKPFLTWRSFTVLEYLGAVILVLTGIVLCFSLTAYTVGTSIRNNYLAFIVMLLFEVLCLFLAVIVPRSSYPFFAIMYTPIWIALQLPEWFTDGGFNYLWSYFETWGACVWLAILSVVAVVSAYKFKRRDIL